MLICLKHQIPLSNSQIFLSGKQIHYYAASQVKLEAQDFKDIYSEHLRQKLFSIGEEISWLAHNYIEFRGMTWLRNQYKSKLIDKGFITKYSRTKFKYHNQQFTDAFIHCYGIELIQAIQPRIVEKLDLYLEYYLLSCDITQTIDRVTHLLIINFLYGSIRNIFD